VVAGEPSVATLLLSACVPVALDIARGTEFPPVMCTSRVENAAIRTAVSTMIATRHCFQEEPEISHTPNGPLRLPRGPELDNKARSAQEEPAVEATMPLEQCSRWSGTCTATKLSALVGGFWPVAAGTGACGYGTQVPGRPYTP
jgi:hypothetical protein